MFRVNEDFLLGKEKNITLCEDGFVVTEDYAVMIDGAGTPSKMDFKGKKGGRYIMEIIREAIYDIEGDLDYLSFLEEISKKIIENYKKNNVYDILKKNVNIRPMASMVVYSRNKHQLWFYGDCKALVNGIQYENPKYIDTVMYEARKMVLEGELLKGKPLGEIISEDKGREYITELLNYQRLFLHARNGSKLAFSMVDGFDFRTEDIKVVNLPKKVDYIILATDGYSVLKPTLEETEEVLKKQLKEDPLAIDQLTGFKTCCKNLNSIDDRAFLKLLL